jgi:hypothetical protein
MRGSTGPDRRDCSSTGRILADGCRRVPLAECSRPSSRPVRDRFSVSCSGQASVSMGVLCVCPRTVSEEHAARAGGTVPPTAVCGSLGSWALPGAERPVRPAVAGAAAGRPAPWLVPSDLTLTAVSGRRDRPARRPAPGCHRGPAEILARWRLPSLKAAGLWLCDESFACYLLQW